MFCFRPFTAWLPRAKEHVLKRSWINELGHRKTLVTHTISRGEKLLETRRPVALNLLTGDVCKACNNGWMNQIDLDVQPVLLKLADGSLLLRDVSRADRRSLSRWLLKTACVLQFTLPPQSRHVPSSIRRQVQRREYLPNGFIAFGTQHKEVDIGAAALDGWLNLPGIQDVGKLPQSQRMKAAFQYNDVVLGCAWITSKRRPVYRTLPAYHEYCIFPKLKLSPTPPRNSPRSISPKLRTVVVTTT